MKRAYLAEFIGTFILMFCGTGAVIIDQQYGGTITHQGIALTFGLVVMCLIYSLGQISGAHLNPAVSIALVLAKHFPAKRLPGYAVSQLAGALSASFALKLLFPANQILGATMPAGTELQSFVLEFFLTFFLMLVIMMVAFGNKETTPLTGIVVGAVIGLEALFAGPVCGASMNPTRSIAPAIVSGHLEHLWLYIVAPIAGAAAAIPVWKFLTDHKKSTITSS